MMSKHIIWLSLSMINFGKNLTSIRKERRLTQLELADLLEVQPRMVGRWEQGVAKPQFDYLIKLAQMLEVSLDRLLLGKEGQISTEFEIKNKRLKELCKQADKLALPDQEIVCHFLDMAIRQDKMKEIMSKSG